MSVLETEAAHFADILISDAMVAFDNGKFIIRPEALGQNQTVWDELITALAEGVDPLSEVIFGVVAKDFPRPQGIAKTVAEQSRTLYGGLLFTNHPEEFYQATFQPSEEIMSAGRYTLIQSVLGDGKDLERAIKTITETGKAVDGVLTVLDLQHPLVPSRLLSAGAAEFVSLTDWMTLSQRLENRYSEEQILAMQRYHQRMIGQNGQ